MKFLGQGRGFGRASKPLSLSAARREIRECRNESRRGCSSTHFRAPLERNLQQRRALLMFARFAVLRRSTNNAQKKMAIIQHNKGIYSLSTFFRRKV
jgi:hypothetical protein